MLRLVLAVVAILSTSVDGQCLFPTAFEGSWQGNAWTNLDISGSSFGTLEFDSRPLAYECFLNEGDRYAIRSETFTFSGIAFRFYVCFNMSLSNTNNDLLYYFVSTGANGEHQNDPVLSKSEGMDPPNMTEICNVPEEPAPQDINILLKDRWQSRLPAGSCPPELQATFSANFANGTVAPNENCTDFPVSGCGDLNRELSFNYTGCGLGVTTLHCVSTLQGMDNVNYTSLYMAPVEGETNPYAPYSCLEQRLGENGTLTITHSAGNCGQTPSQSMVLEEVESCRLQLTTPAPGDGSTTGSNSSLTPTSPPSGGNGGQGGGGNGDVSDGDNGANQKCAGVLSLVAALAVVKMAL